MKTIVFDFDNTLTTYDTIFPFLCFANNDGKLKKLLKKGVLLLYRIAYRLKLLSNFQLKNKAIRLFILDYSQEQIQQASQKFLDILGFHENVYACFCTCLDAEDTKVYISTASFLDYVELLKKTFPKLIIQASKLSYQGNKVKGLKSNNYGDAKIKNWEGGKIDALFTDSLSDLPLAKISKEINIVTKNGRLKTCGSLNQFIQYCKYN